MRAVSAVAELLVSFDQVTGREDGTPYRLNLLGVYCSVEVEKVEVYAAD